MTPQKWKAAILADTAKDKKAAVEFVARRFPDVELLATPRSRVPRDGMAEACCLALMRCRANSAYLPSPTAWRHCFISLRMR